MSSADPDVKDDCTDMTALMWSVWKGYSETVEILLKKGASVRVADKNARIALMAAAWEGHADIARVLLERGAEANATDYTGATPLMWVAWKGRTDTTELFLENEVKVNAREKEDDRTALIGAEFEGHVETVQVPLL